MRFTFLFISLFTLILITPEAVLSQDIEATTSDGKTVVLKDDGTWSYKKMQEDPAPLSNIDCEYERKEVNDFSGEEILITSPVEIGTLENVGRNNPAIAYLQRVGEVVAFMFRGNADLGCIIEKDSRIQIKLSNGEVFEFYNVLSSECDDSFSISAIFLDGDLDRSISEEQLKKRTDEIIQAFKNSPLDKLRIHGSEYYVNVELSDDGKNFFRNYFQCIKL